MCNPSRGMDGDDERGTTATMTDSLAKVGRHLALSSTVMVGLAACSEGCSSQPLPVSEPAFEEQPMSFSELDELLEASSNGRWRPLPEHQLFAIEHVVSMVLGQAKHAGLGPGQARRAAKLAAVAGLELRSIVIDHEGHSEVLWLLREPDDDRRGRGTYLIRLGELDGGADVELLLQAPHTRYDKFTGTIALALFFDGGAHLRPRALFLNSLHRYVQEDGTRKKREPPEANPSDPTHREDHPLARATAQVLADHQLAVVQLHGFDRSPAAGDPDMIVSAGSKRPHAAVLAMAERLRAGLAEVPIGVYGIDSGRLGAETNVQGMAARTSARCFVHLELSQDLRVRLRDEQAVRASFAIAVFGADAQVLRGCT